MKLYITYTKDSFTDTQVEELSKLRGGYFLRRSF